MYLYLVCLLWLGSVLWWLKCSPNCGRSWHLFINQHFSWNKQVFGCICNICKYSFLFKEDWKIGVRCVTLLSCCHLNILEMFLLFIILCRWWSLSKYAMFKQWDLCKLWSWLSVFLSEWSHWKNLTIRKTMPNNIGHFKNR
jgi:hypothetical protein